MSYGFSPAIISEIVDLTSVTEDGVKKTSVPVSDSLIPEFELNDYGFPLNDMSALVKAQSLEEYNMLVNRLSSYQANNPDTSKLSQADLIRGIMPRSMQTPFEIERVASAYGSSLQDELNRCALSDAVKAAQNSASSSSSDSTVSTT